MGALNKFSKDLTDVINAAIKSGVPIPFICMTLDSTKFELQTQNLALMNRDKAMQMADGISKNGAIKFTPKIVIEEGGK